MNKKLLTYLLPLCLTIFAKGQTTYNGNGNSGFGDVLGSSDLTISDNGNLVTIQVNKGTADFNDAMVMYISTEAEGRSIIDNTVNDQGDDLRRSISSAGQNASNISFPSGFKARYAVAIDTLFGGIWEIPANGSIANNDLNFIDNVNSNLTSSTQSSFSFSFEWSEIGLNGAPTDNLDFVVTYLNAGNGFLSNEGYGNGLPSAGNPGSSDVMFTQYFRYSNNLGSMSGPIVGGIARTQMDGQWSDPTTWVNGNIPLEDDAIILEHDILLDLNAAANNLTVTTGSLDIHGNESLFASGLIAGNNALTVNGTLSVMDAVVTGDVVFGDTGTLKVENGISVFQDDLYFESTDLGSGQIEEVEGTLSINGLVTVERFIPVASGTTASNGSTRAYRFLASPVNTTGTIFENWQENGVDTNGFGTQITGPGGATNGFDPSETNNPSLFTFDNASTLPDQSQSWQVVGNTNNTGLEVGKGYRMFIRGNRAYDLSSSPANPPNADVTLRATGNIITGTTTQQLSSQAGFYSMIANPYQAIVDMSLLSYNNIDDDNYYVWDPNLGQFGAYVVVDINNGTNTSGTDANQFLMPGQSAFVQTLVDGQASISFSESAKSTGEPATSVFSDEPELAINVRLYPKGADSAVDGVLIRLGNNYSSAISAEDAGKMGNPGENIATRSESILLSIDKRPYLNNDEAIELSTWNFRDIDYTLEVFMGANDLLGAFYLADALEGTETELTPGVNNIAFNGTSKFIEKRFSIVYKTESLDEPELIEGVTMYPNPVHAGDAVTMVVPELRQMDAHIEVYGMNGQVVRSADVNIGNNGQTLLETDALNAGLYLIQITAGDISLSRKLIIK